MHQYIDILFFALLAFFIAGKLFNILGQQGGVDHAIKTNGRKAANENNEINLNAQMTNEQLIQKIAPSFKESVFLENSDKAIQTIFDLYIEGNTEVLSELIDISCLKKFAYNISRLEEQKLDAHIRDIKITSTKALNIELKNKHATYHLIKNIEYIEYLECENKVLFGSKNKIKKLNLKLSFTKNLLSEDPTWKLSSIDELPFTEYLDGKE